LYQAISNISDADQTRKKSLSKTKVTMKKQFTIKAAQTVKNIKLSAVKNESSNVLNFLKDTECCAWSAFQGLAPKANFSL
jgi:hypothetical protein